MSISFAPLDDDAVEMLMDRTGIDYRHCDFTGPQWLCATSRDVKGKIDGVFIAEFTSSFEAHWTCAVDNPAIISRRLLRALFGALFSRAVRVTALTRPDNFPSISGIERLGFTYEGFIRLGIEGKWDALMFGMLRNECKWIAPKEVSREIAKAA